MQGAMREAQEEVKVVAEAVMTRRRTAVNKRMLLVSRINKARG